MVKRSAFTLIELIFTIVIIAIIVLSIPMMTQVTSETLEGSIDQEAIFGTSAKVLQVLSFPWDENSSDIELVLEGANVISGIVDIPIGTSSLDFNSTACRSGVINRFCRIDNEGSEVNVSNLGNDHTSVLIRGIDDSNGTSTLNAGSAQGYKNQYRTITTIAYVSDNNHSGGGQINYNDFNPFGGNSFIFSSQNIVGPSNLRMITVTTERNENGIWNPVTVLRSYAANIGEIKPYKRTY